VPVPPGTIGCWCRRPDLRSCLTIRGREHGTGLASRTCRQFASDSEQLGQSGRRSRSGGPPPMQRSQRPSERQSARRLRRSTRDASPEGSYSVPLAGKRYGEGARVWAGATRPHRQGLERRPDCAGRLPSRAPVVEAPGSCSATGPGVGQEQSRAPPLPWLRARYRPARPLSTTTRSRRLVAAGSSQSAIAGYRSDDKGASGPGVCPHLRFARSGTDGHEKRTVNATTGLVDARNHPAIPFGPALAATGRSISTELEPSAPDRRAPAAAG
jgi:hypothetical protein